ncbi:acetyl-CoA carboxylase biotin carboxyl carrier protein subunit [Pseudomonas sp. 3A(2025)]
MKPERIKSLIDLMVESDLSELCLSEGDAQLRLLREPGQAVASNMLPAAPIVAATVPAPVAPPPAATGTDVCASLYGVLHLTPTPDQPPFVEVGAAVEAGQTLAVIEAMKMFHPLKAQVAGVVSAILVKGGEEVQAGQVLIRIG